MKRNKRNEIAAADAATADVSLRAPAVRQSKKNEKKPQDSAMNIYEYEEKYVKRENV